MIKFVGILASLKQGLGKFSPLSEFHHLRKITIFTYPTITGL